MNQIARVAGDSSYLNTPERSNACATTPAATGRLAGHRTEDRVTALATPPVLLDADRSAV